MSPQTLYAAYCHWCEALKIMPANFETWHKTVQSIQNYSQANQ